MNDKNAKPLPLSAPIRGVVFDLDGTIVDSALDFDAMRAEIGLSPGLPILEAIANMPEAEGLRATAILERHEHAGALRATLMPGIIDFFGKLDALGIRRAVWTRNSRAAATATLARLDVRFEWVVARDDAPAKPDPSAIRRISQAWNMDCREIAVIGDFVFDLDAGRRAGSPTVLFTAGESPDACRGHELADFHLASFAEAEALLRWMAAGDCRH